MPEHLRRPSSMSAGRFPGPGTYPLPSSIMKSTRPRTSQQVCTWSRAPACFSNLPKKNPGPGTYRPDDGETLVFHNKSESLNLGYSFPRDGQNGYCRELKINANPGPGTHEIPEFKP